MKSSYRDDFWVKMLQEGIHLNCCFMNKSLVKNFVGEDRKLKCLATYLNEILTYTLSQL